MLREATGLADAGQPAEALHRLEAWFARNASRTPPADMAVLRLQAARFAAAADDVPAARAQLAEARRLAPSLRAAPLLQARLLRQLARVAEQIGAPGEAIALLGQAGPGLLAAGDRAGAAEAANALGALRLEALRPAEAAADFTRATDLAPDAEMAVTALTNLANAWTEAGRADRARQAAARAEAVAGTDPKLLRAARFATAQILLREPDLPAAEALLESLIADPTDDGVRGHALALLASSRFDRGRLPEAAEAGLAALDAYRATLGERHPATARLMQTLGSIHALLGDPRLGQDFLARAAGIQRALFGAMSPQLQATEIERAWLDIHMGDVGTGERRARAALAALRIIPPPDRRQEALATIALGLAAEQHGRADEAAHSFRRAQAIIEEVRGPYSPDLGFSLIRLGRLLTREGRLAEAAPPLDRAIALYGRLGASDAVRLSEALTARAELRALQGDRRGALEEGRQAFALLRGRVDTTGTAAETQRRGARELFWAQASLFLDVAPDDTGAREDAFAATQEAVASRAGEALRRAEARRAAGDGPLADLLRDIEAQGELVRQTDALLRGAASRPGTTADAEHWRSLRDAALSELHAKQARIAAEFPAYARLARPPVARLAEMQALLAGDEALLAPLATGEGLLLWVVTSDAARALRLATTEPALSDLVRRIRAGVDLGAAGSAPFDIAAARALHAALIAPAEATGLLAGRGHLLLVPEGALQSLPPHLLIESSGDGQLRWLVRRYAITIAPSIAAAVARRSEAARASTADLAMLGIGDPRVDVGDAGVALRGSAPALRRALAQLAALPETAHELRSMSAVFGQSRSRLLFGPDATKDMILHARPELYRVLAFATHALMGGELPGLAEPAIVLTGAGETPQGALLTASEIANWHLDADLVILSACNTAAPEAGPYAEGLSGLARAFFQAGARTLLVSHWAVASDATVVLMTEFAKAVAERQGRAAAALQSAMLRMIDGPDPALAHPAYWSPFVVVGG